MAKKSKKNKDSVKDGYSGITIPTEDTEVTVSVDITPSTEEDCEKDQEEGTKVEETTEVNVSVEVDVTPTPEDCEKEEEEGTTQVEVTVEADVTTPTSEDCEKEEEEGTTQVEVSVEVDVTPSTEEDCEKDQEEGTTQVEVTVEADVTTPTPEDCEKEEEEGTTQVEVSVEVDVNPSVEEGEECEEEVANTEVDVSVDVPVTPNNNECVEIPSSEWNSQAIKDAINFGTEWSVQKAIKKGNFASSCDYEIKEIKSVCKRENGDNTYYTFSNLAKVDDGKKCYALTSNVTVKTCGEEESVTKWKYNVSTWRD